MHSPKRPALGAAPSEELDLVSSIDNNVDDEFIPGRVKMGLGGDTSIKRFDIASVTHKGPAQASGFVGNLSRIEHAIEVTPLVSKV